MFHTKQIHPIDELLNDQRRTEKEANRKMLLRILHSLRFLTRQGLPLRGSEGDADSNFYQLLRLQQADFPEVVSWLSRKTNKYTSHDVQNECLQLMALLILWQTNVLTLPTKNSLQYASGGSMRSWMIARTLLVSIKLVALMLTVWYELSKISWSDWICQYLLAEASAMTALQIWVVVRMELLHKSWPGNLHPLSCTCA